MVMALGHDGPRAYRPKGDGNLGGTPPDYPGLDENRAKHAKECGNRMRLTV